MLGKYLNIIGRLIVVATNCDASVVFTIFLTFHDFMYIHTWIAPPAVDYMVRILLYCQCFNGLVPGLLNFS